MSCILFRCLPRKRRVLLARADLKCLAEQADEPWTQHAVKDMAATDQRLTARTRSLSLLFAPAVTAPKGPAWLREGRQEAASQGVKLGGRPYGPAAKSCHIPRYWQCSYVAWGG